MAAELKVREDEVYEPLRHWLRHRFRAITAPVLQLIILSYINEAEIRTATETEAAILAKSNNRARGNRGKKKVKPSVIRPSK